jgi:hypothetical protein
MCGIADFPSRARPVILLPSIERTRTDSVQRLFQLHGFAADGVARIVVMVGNDVAAELPVVANTISREFSPAVAATEIRALDDAGVVVFRQDVRSTGRP